MILKIYRRRAVVYRQHVCMGCRKLSGSTPDSPTKRYFPNLKAQNQVAPKARMEWWGRGAPRGGAEGQKGGGGMKEKERERSESLGFVPIFWIICFIS